MSQFDIIDHTADIGVTVYGKYLKDLFTNAAHAMFSLMANLDNMEEKIIRKIEITAPDQESLLVSWLNELLYIYDAEYMLFKRFDIIHLDENRLKAKASGEKINLERHELKTDIKAATYHMLKIEKTVNDSFRAQIIFDT
ncbi:MAG: archease [Planctomycetota bacterium]|jgi:SHS2 domain-containing protein